MPALRDMSSTTVFGATVILLLACEQFFVFSFFLLKLVASNLVRFTRSLVGWGVSPNFVRQLCPTHGAGAQLPLYFIVYTCANTTGYGAVGRRRRLGTRRAPQGNCAHFSGHITGLVQVRSPREPKHFQPAVRETAG